MGECELFSRCKWYAFYFYFLLLSLLSFYAYVNAFCIFLNILILSSDRPTLTGYANDYFFFGAAKDEDSFEWYWEESGNWIQEFFWGENQPDLAGNLERACISFSFRGQWQDDNCESSVLNALCEGPDDDDYYDW